MNAKQKAERLKLIAQEKKLYDEITDVVRSLYSEKYSSFALMLYQRLASSSTNAAKLGLYKMKMNKILDDAKYNELVSLANSIRIDCKLSNLLEVVKNDKSKFLIFTEFLSTQDYIAKNLENNGYSVTIFNGSMSLNEKSESVKRFKSESQIMVSTGAGGEGQNFQFCHNIVNYDLPWNPMRIEQKIGRVHRIGQTSDVQIYNYAVKDTIEAYILELLYTKIELFTMTLGELDLMFEDSASEGLSKTWFKEYMTATDTTEIQNKFTSLGDGWKERKQVTLDAVNNFNRSVFDNFDLSSFEKGKKK